MEEQNQQTNMQQEMGMANQPSVATAPQSLAKKSKRIAPRININVQNKKKAFGSAIEKKVTPLVEPNHQCVNANNIPINKVMQMNSEQDSKTAAQQQKEIDGLKEQTFSHERSQDSDGPFSSTNFASNMSSAAITNSQARKSAFSSCNNEVLSGAHSNQGGLGNLDEAEPGLEQDPHEFSDLLEKTGTQIGAAACGSIQMNNYGLTGGPSDLQLQQMINLGQPKLCSQISHPPHLSQSSQQNTTLTMKKPAPIYAMNALPAPPSLKIHVSELSNFELNQQPSEESKKAGPTISLLDALSFELGEPLKSMQQQRSKEDIMSMEELMAASQPLQGPGFDPETQIEDWSDDSSDEENMREPTDQEMLDELLGGTGTGPMPHGGVPLRRTVAAIYMPIRVNCLYG